MYRQIFIDAKIENWKQRSRNRADREKFIKEVEVGIGL